MENIHNECNLKENKFHCSYKVTHQVNDLDLATLKVFLSKSYPTLFDSSLYYNFVMLLDTNLSIVSYHINRKFMVSDIKLYPGLSFKREFMGKTSVTECLEKQNLSVAYCSQNENPAFQSFSNCTIPIKNKEKTIAYLSTFFLHSNSDEFSVDYFKMFTQSLEINSKLYALKINISEYACKIMLPNFSMDSLSTTELEVLNELNKGYSNKEIANRLFISENTVKSCVQIISQKLSCANRTQVAVNSTLYSILKFL